MSLVHADENKRTLKKYEELWDKIRDFIRSITNKFDIMIKIYEARIWFRWWFTFKENAKTS